MIDLLYVLGFWFFALLYILIKSIKANEIVLNLGFLKKLTQYSTIIKAFPAGLATLFVLYTRHESIYLSVILSLGLLFCMFGDLSMEKGLIPGLPIFLIAQIILMLTFAVQAFNLNASSTLMIESLILTGIMILGLAIYILLFLRYLESSNKGLGKFRIPVMIYCIFISGMLSASVLLWRVSNVMEFGLVVFGALLFVISDSIIAVREFHHDISYREIKVMSTYFAAIFLISLSPLLILS
jgi:uncharacterized membrane protein YhhN